MSYPSRRSAAAKRVREALKPPSGLVVFGGVVVSFLSTQLTGTTILGRIGGVGLALVAAFGVAALAIATIYRVFPHVRLAWRPILRGTLTAAGSISVLSLAFTIYLSYGTDFQSHYATSGVAALVLFSVWLFLSNALLLVGFKVALGTD